MNHINNEKEIDRFSFQLGMINCFVEMVACGVKKLALSPPLLPDDYHSIAAYSDEIVQGFRLKTYLEKSLLITKLQSQEFTKGKWSILFYKTDDVLRDYLNLKEKRARLQEEGRLDSSAEVEISGEFMRLLSYPEEIIKEKISGLGQDPYMLIHD